MRRSSSFLFAATAILLVGTIAFARLTERRVPGSLVIPLDGISHQIDGWLATGDEQIDQQTLRTLAATSYLLRTYQRQGTQMGVFVAYYAQQRAGESMHSPKNCLPGGGWEIWKEDSAVISVGARQFRVNMDSIQNLGQRMLMLYWYQSKDRVIASEYLGKILLARDTLLTGRTAASIVRITLPDLPGMDQQGLHVASDLIPEVQRCFTGRAF